MLVLYSYFEEGTAGNRGRRADRRGTAAPATGICRAAAGSTRGRLHSAAGGDLVLERILLVHQRDGGERRHARDRPRVILQSRGILLGRTLGRVARLGGAYHGLRLADPASARAWPHLRGGQMGWTWPRPALMALAAKIERHGVDANRLLHKRFPLPRGARQVIAASLKRARHRRIIAGATALWIVGGARDDVVAGRRL